MAKKTPTSRERELQSRLRECGRRFMRCAAQLAEARELLGKVARVIDSTNPEHHDFVDSGADSIGFLCQLEGDIRAALARGRE